MLRFDFDAFDALLRSVPAPVPLYDRPEHSEYLQREVFDKLSGGETVDLSLLDLDAFDFRHVAPESDPEHYQREMNSWQKGANRIFKLLPPMPRESRSFF